MGYGIELKNRITGETAKMRHPRLVRFYSRGVYSNKFSRRVLPPLQAVSGILIFLKIHHISDV